MNALRKLLFLIPVTLFMCNLVSAQISTGIKDTLSVREQKEQKSDVKTRSQANWNNTGVKQVRSARPDMSKARGARPPYITRPSGSGIPKGIGKSQGSKSPGKR